MRSLSGEVKLWNRAARREIITFKAHTTMVGAVKFSPDGRLLVLIQA
jgi:WD40 repeat protein